jgi:hypothetical protein
VIFEVFCNNKLNGLYFILCTQLITEKIIEDSRTKLAASVELCKQTLKSGSISYAISPSVVDAMWKVKLFFFLLAL